MNDKFFNQSLIIPDLTMDDSNIIPFDQSESKPRFSPNSMKSNLVVQASEIIEDPQILVNVLSKRVAQLNQGRSPLIDTVPSMGAADIALTEIIEGKVVLSESKED
ncbi:MAG: DNA-directed RNA polymerase subunit omega [Akkermansiaceae bacterium]|nr:DNA-directed RNA polymerase subunit omega [Akkermansiaceae bacterium]